MGVAPVLTLAPVGSRPITLELRPFWALGPGGFGFAEVGVASGFVVGPVPGVDCVPGGGAAGPREMLWCGCGGCALEWFIDGEKGSKDRVGRQRGAGVRERAQKA